MRVLVTGSAGFIGYHLVKRLIKEKINVIGIDNINDYYDQSLKEDRLKDLQKLSDSSSYSFFKIALEDREQLKNLFQKSLIYHTIQLILYFMVVQAHLLRKSEKPLDME